MSSIRKGFISLCIPLVALLIVVSGCENPGNVGGGLVNNSELVYDTLAFSGIDEIQLNGYSGGTNLLPVGRYHDPVYGKISVRSLVKPSFQTRTSNQDVIDENYSMKLVLNFDSLQVYGDTLAQTNFTVYEVNSAWRGSDWKIGDEFSYDQGNPIGAFTLANEDTIEIDLADSWKEKYAVYFNNDSTENLDSLYNNNFHGLALIPDSASSKVKFANMPVNFMLHNTEDTVTIAARDWGYTVNRSEVSLPENTLAIHNTLENVIRIDTASLNLKELKNKPYTRVVLELQEASEALDQSIGISEVRPYLGGLRMDAGSGLDLLYELQFSELSGRDDVTAIRDTTENKFRFNITSLVNNYIFGSLDSEYIYISTGSETGLLLSALLYNKDAEEGLKPKLIITSLSEEEGQ
ncbi:MAG: DUF4270 domain-containing protein [Balneolaceae bacterium]|nr:DUF4270 domain-containing protein [Balneolaceae bacterium]